MSFNVLCIRAQGVRVSVCYNLSLVKTDQILVPDTPNHRLSLIVSAP